MTIVEIFPSRHHKRAGLGLGGADNRRFEFRFPGLGPGLAPYSSFRTGRRDRICRMGLQISGSFRTAH